MKTLNILKNNRQNLINNLNENIVSLEKIAFEQQAEIERLKARNDELNALNKSASIEAVKATIVEIGNRLCHYGKCDEVYMYEVLDVMVEVEEELTNTKSKEADENKRAKIAIQSFQEAGYRLSEDMAKSADERYKNIIEALNNNAMYPPLIAITLDMVINSAKSEAIKEFAERVRELWANYDGYEFETKFDNLVKEMVGDDNA